MVILVEEEASFSLELINGSAENEAAMKVPNLITFSREAERFVCLSRLFVGVSSCVLTLLTSEKSLLNLTRL